MEGDIRDFVTAQFKYSNLTEVAFAIGAYCLFKQKPEYIRYLWEYKQPPDSDAGWIGSDITPNTIISVLQLYLGRGLIERKINLI